MDNLNLFFEIYVSLYKAAFANKYYFVYYIL